MSNAKVAYKYSLLYMAATRGELIVFSVYNGLKDSEAFVEKLVQRSQNDYGEAEKTVSEIVAAVRARGDEALFEYTQKFDGIELNKNNIRVNQDEIETALNQVDSELINVIKRAAERIKLFHEKQKMNSWLEPSQNGEILGQLVRPLEKVGVYVPGGKAAYPSSLLMNIIPAKVAGVKKIIMMTPPQKDGSVYPVTIAAAVTAGIDEIYKCGGAQAIAAMAFGTESVPSVDKIVGPGNIYVALAKRSVYGHVNIDSVAGPSEILILADESANSEFIAADLLSQAEHDEMASSVLITDSSALAEAVKANIDKQKSKLERLSIIDKSLENYGAVIVVENMLDAVELCNKIAPEHLEVCTKQPFELLCHIQNAGAIFLGNYTPEPLGDYMAGPNHILPTGGTARFFSPLSIDDFIKKSSVLSFSEEAFSRLGNDIISFANAEGLTAHANSARIRLNRKSADEV